MNFFKSQFSFAFAISAAALAVGCAKAPDSTTQLADSGTFIVEPITAISSENQPKDAWNLQRTDLLSLKTCVKDIGRLEPVIGQNFTLKIGEHEQTVTTNAQGCLNWNETIDFDYAAPETFVQQEHVFIASRPHRGTQTVSVAINPWRTDPSALVDLRYGSAPRLAQSSVNQAALSSTRARAMGGAEVAELFAGNIGVEITQTNSSQSNADLNLHLTIHPQLNRKHLDGVSYPESLKGGDFKISVALIEHIGNEQTTLAKIDGTTAIQNETLNWSTRFKLTQLPRRNTQLEMIYRLETLGGASAIGADEGIFTLPSLLSSGSFATQRLNVASSSLLKEPTSSNSVNKTNPVPASASATNGASNSNTCNNGSDRFGFYFDDWKVESGGVLKTTREGVPSEVGMNIRFCLRDSLDNRTVSGQILNLQLFNGAQPAGKMSSVTTDTQGCAYLNGNLRFDYFQPEHWLQRTLHVSSPNAPYEKISKNLSLQVNPWQLENFSWDCRQGQAPRAATSQAAQLDITDFSYAFVGQDFDLDRQLSLTFNRRYQFRMQPVIRRQAAFDKRMTAESLNDGTYHLRILVLSPNDATVSDSINNASAFKYLSSYEGDVQARGGLILQEITLPFEFSALPLVATRNRIFVELSPANRTTLRSVTVSGAFNALNETGGSGLLASTQGVRELSERLTPHSLQTGELLSLAKTGKAQKGSLLDSPIALYRGLMNLRELTAQDSKAGSITAADIDSLIANPENESFALRKFCNLFFKDSINLSVCKVSPRSALKIFTTRHIDKVLSKPTEQSSSVSTISVNAGLSHDSSMSSSDSKGSSVSTGIGVSGGIGGRIGVGSGLASLSGGSLSAGADVSISYGKNWFTTHSENQSSGKSSSLSLTFGKSLTAESIDLTFDAQVRTCVVIVPTSSSDQKGFHICPKSAGRQTHLSETWYSIIQSYTNDSTPLRDTGRIENRPWATVLRGKRAFDGFRNLLEDRTRNIRITPNAEFEALSQAGTDPSIRFVTTGPRFNEGAFPGMLGDSSID